MQTSIWKSESVHHKYTRGDHQSSGKTVVGFYRKVESPHRGLLLCCRLCFDEAKALRIRVTLELDDLDIPPFISTRILGQIDKVAGGTRVPLVMTRPFPTALTPIQRAIFSTLCHKNLAAQTIRLRARFAMVQLIRLGPHHICRRSAGETQSDISLNNAPERQQLIEWMLFIHPRTSIPRIGQVKLWVSWTYNVTGSLGSPPIWPRQLWTTNYHFDSMMIRWDHELHNLPAAEREVVDKKVTKKMFLSLRIGAPLAYGESPQFEENSCVSCIHEMEQAVP